MNKTAFCLPLILALACSPSALAAGGAASDGPSQPGSRLEVAMTLYAGGITMGQMSLDTTLRGGSYHSVSTLQTSGVVNAFLVAFDRLMWLFDGAVKLRENAHALSTSLAPLGRSLELLAAQPELRAGLTVALVLTTALWWFIQHRRVEGPGRMHDVSAFL